MTGEEVMAARAAKVETGAEVYLVLSDAIRTGVGSETAKAVAFSHVDDDSTALMLSWMHEDREPRYTPPVLHKSAAKEGDAFWLFPEEYFFEYEMAPAPDATGALTYNAS